VSLIRFDNVGQNFGTRAVLRNVFFRLDNGDRVGLIGRNGVGKTTVLRLILGQQEPTEGSIEVAPGIRASHFSQFSELGGQQSILDVLESLYSHVRAIESRLAEIASLLAGAPQGPELTSLVNQQAELLEEMEHREGWTYQHRIDIVLTRLGFPDAYRTMPIDRLSAGWRNRAALAKMLLEAPDVFLMDEPTNYLDVDGLEWLEEWLQNVRGALIVVSHDRHFLDRVANRIVEIENYHFQEYQGGFSQYVREKQLRLRTLERQFQHEEELLAFEAEAIADRREMAKNPSKALRRRLADIKRQVEPRPVDRIVTELYEGLYVAEKLCEADTICKAYGGQLLFRDLSFELHRGDHIAIMGPNGCGKTTLLNALAGLEPLDSGRVTWAKAVAFSYYNMVLSALDPNDTVTHAVNTVGLACRAPRRRVNRFLSLLGFSESDLRQKIGTLSGGQKARVALAQCLLSGASVILLDEPTNHLDLTSTQVMERALLHYPGSTVVVSHDRFFIDKVASRLLVFAGAGRIQEVNANWTLWQASRE
jgi:ATPase subunit of ABC transporter with duplicated ATPase domains